MFSRLLSWPNPSASLCAPSVGSTKSLFTLLHYIPASLSWLFLPDLVTGLIKSVMFGIPITAVGCLEGLSTGAGAEEVGRSTTQAVVKSIFLVVVVDLLFTALFFFAGN